MLPRAIRTTHRLGLVAGLCTLLVSVAHAQAIEGAPGEAIKAYADKAGPPGSPERMRAIRDAIRKSADQMKDPGRDGGYTRSARVSLPADEPGSETDDPSAGEPLEIDKDERYQAWLENEAAADPIVDVDLGDGNGGKIQMRSVGGEFISRATVFPEIALAFEPATGNVRRDDGFCSGVLIDRRTVLTAAHCLCGGTVNYVLFGISVRDSNRYPIKVVGRKRHDGVRCAGAGTSNTDHWLSLRGRDIAVLRLEKDVPEHVVGRLGTLAPPNVIHEEYGKGNRHLIVVGFGHTSRVQGRGDNDAKNYSRVPILSPDCSGSTQGQSDEAKYRCKRGHEILAVDRASVGPCPGDSGGGAYILVDDTEQNRKHALVVGLVSRSIFYTREKCGDGAIYTLLTADMINWAQTAARDLANQQ